MRTEEEIQASAAPGERPFSNHTEYDMWADRYCYECVNDDDATETYCPILSVALLGSWPQEWTRARREFTTVDGNPAHYDYVDTCTEFEERRKGGGGEPKPPTPKPVVQCDGQLDIVDAYLDTAIDELTAVPVEVPS